MAKPQRMVVPWTCTRLKEIHDAQVPIRPCRHLFDKRWGFAGQGLEVCSIGQVGDSNVVMPHHVATQARNLLSNQRIAVTQGSFLI